MLMRKSNKKNGDIEEEDSLLEEGSSPKEGSFMPHLQDPFYTVRE